MAFESFGDDAFSAAAVGSPTLSTAVKPRPPALPTATDWYRGLYDDVPLAQLTDDLRLFTLREMCPFGLDWSYKARAFLIHCVHAHPSTARVFNAVLDFVRNDG